jgi:hypothetical protein
MDSDGISQFYPSGPNFCLMTANDTVVQAVQRPLSVTAL